MCCIAKYLVIISIIITITNLYYTTMSPCEKQIGDTLAEYQST